MTRRTGEAASQNEVIVAPDIDDGAVIAPAQSVRRAIEILFAFTGDGETLGVTQIGKKLGLAKSVVHRTLGSLLEAGLVIRDAEAPRYRLGPRAVELGMAALGAPDLRLVALPIMQELVFQTNESSATSVLVGRERLYIAQVESPQDVRMSVPIGIRYPLYAGASGKAILAHLTEDERQRYLDETALEPMTASTIGSREDLARELERIERNGFSYSMGERDPWAAAFAAPIFNSHRAVGAISVCGPRTRITERVVEEFAPLLRNSAQQFSEMLGARPSLEASL